MWISVDRAIRERDPAAANTLDIPVHFTRLRLLGFKSFVDPTELVIAPGLTGVVGPNGCGKSNLLEALRWVMGENRPSAMRGDGMEDVIFAGSGSRPARNHAEVTLTIDNRERLAPSAFNDADQVEIVRRITRDAGSAFRANGREARARDIQILFADASTGSHSPALVRQGQISELINARPKARRRILEEAAGISGLYQRRHEAELKLRATETNLGRVGDVIEALDGQLGALARQARQAARYREIAEALRRAESLLLWRIWHDADRERRAAAEALTAALRAAGAGQSAASEAARLRAEAEERLPALRDEDAIAAAVLQRLTLERDRIDGEAEMLARQIAGLETQIAQMVADRERETTLDGDAKEVVQRLTAEKGAVEAEAEGHDDLLAEARAAAETSAAALREAEAAFEGAAEAAAQLVAEHQSAGRTVAETRRRFEEATRGGAQAESAAAAVGADLEKARPAMAVARTAAQDAAERAESLEAALAEAEAGAGAARTAASGLKISLAEADGAARALAAEVAGLDKLLARDRGSDGQILDAIRVEPGFEAALGAALAEDLRLPLANDDPQASGWRALPPVEDAPGLPEGATPLAPRVAAPPALARRLAAIGIVARADGPRLQGSLGRGQRLVSLEGDLWRWDGLAVAAGDAPSAAALRLQQRNRSEAAKAALAEAEAAAAAARADVQQAEAAAETATRRESEARLARKSADQAATTAARDLTRAETALEALEGKAAALQAACRRRREETAAARTAFETAEKSAAALADASEAKAAVEAERVRLEAARISAMTRRGEAEEIARSGAARARRLDEIAAEIGNWTARQATAAQRLQDLARREAEAEQELATLRSRPSELAQRRTKLAKSLEAAETRRRAASDALATAETELRARDAAARAAERAASEAREARARSEALAEAAEARAASAADRLRAELEREPGDVPADFGIAAEAVPGATDLEAEVDRLRRQRDGLGAVNLRAEEDAREIAAEREGLARERADLEEAIAKLRQGIASLNREGRGRLLAAFDEVNRNFAVLFKHLFGGGEASLVMVESDDPLEAGLEIMCQPPGKKLSTLSLLSGGEQTLTALSLIFGVFLANPSPICVLDEVDAPLDDANVTRFCDLLDEMTERTSTRFLIITHHAITMSRMGRLFGVTMAEKGVSQLVSVDLAAAERIVESA